MSFLLSYKLTNTLVSSALRYFGSQMASTHSKHLLKEHGSFNVRVVPALSDNFMYLVTENTSKEAFVVDPVEAQTIADLVSKEGLKLTTVLTTHHHYDHSGGNEQLAQLIPGLKFLGFDDRVPALNRVVKDGERFSVGGIEIDCIHTPCHTTGHVCYNVSAKDSISAVFTGDTLFIAGCGRFFEGSAQDMFSSFGKLKALSDETLVYCGHEYTVNNLKFATTVENGNEDVRKKLNEASAKRAEKQPTVPSSIALEKLINPFMRAANVEQMGEFRSLKDNWKA